MNTHRVFTMKCSNVYPLHVRKTTGEGRREDDVGQVIRWPTGRDRAGLQRPSEQGHGSTGGRRASRWTGSCRPEPRVPPRR
ncbi:DUF2200 family protein [Luteimonas wenzhouensis]|uniref:DUF2200 domain-containing protein n=1 Tax=Luteimonas wenzhouensis TaxID=2599615 RepID=A0A5C5TW50_9GAMM|nr:DUF2200 domain-containing protein [Luteimonas wenzhouensis]